MVAVDETIVYKPAHLTARAGSNVIEETSSQSTGR
jgi:hypothetical protein